MDDSRPVGVRENKLTRGLSLKRKVKILVVKYLCMINNEAIMCLFLCFSLSGCSSYKKEVHDLMDPVKF